ncbi:MAG TPA: CAP domain-containing protein [Anaerolineales bacterium]
MGGISANRKTAASLLLCLVFLSQFLDMGSTDLPLWRAAPARLALGNPVQLALARPALAPSLGEAGGLIAAVNDMRASHGLFAYKVSSALMASAQAQSDYQASINTSTHTGSGSSTPGSRATAAGYSGGYVVENIAAGRSLAPQTAVQWWTGDSPHLNTMLNPNGRDIGAGVATAGDYVYYTLDVGIQSGASGSSANQVQAATPAAGSSQAPQTPLPTAAVIMPVQVATPNPDGSIVHIVGPGQALISIALAYNIKLADLLALNRLTSQSVIYPGQKLIIKPPDDTPTPTSTGTPMPPTATATRPPTQTPVPTWTPDSAVLPAGSTPIPAAAVNARSTADSNGLASDSEASAPDPILLVIGVLVFLGIGLIALGSLLKRGASQKS